MYYLENAQKPREQGRDDGGKNVVMVMTGTNTGSKEFEWGSDERDKMNNLNT